MESVQKSLALQGLMGQQDLQGLQLDEARRGAEANQRLQALFSSNPNATPEDVMRIDPAKGLKMRQDLLTNRKTEGEIAKTATEVDAARAKLGRDLIASANPQNYQTIIAEGRRLGQKWADTAPPEFDPVWQRQNVIGADKWLEVNAPKVTSVQDGGVTRMVDTNTFTNPGITARTFSTADPGKDLVLPGADGTYKPNAPLVDAKKQVAAAGASKTVVNMADGQKGFDNELKLRGDFRSEPVYKAHQEMTSAHQQISGALKQGTPVGDLAGATKIMKLLDPGSVVRESELGMAMAASGLMDRITNYANMVTSGQKLTPTQRADFQKLADALFSESVNQYNKKRAEYTGLASNYGLNPERVTGAEVRMPSAPTTDPTKMSDADLLKALGVKK